MKAAAISAEGGNSSGGVASNGSTGDGHSSSVQEGALNRQQQQSKGPTIIAVAPAHPPVIMTKAERQREKTRLEVEQVLVSLGNTRTQLDHFNLLGVVANPRRSEHGTAGASSATSPMAAAMAVGVGSSHNTVGGSGAQHNADGNSSDEASSFLFTETYQSLESTLSSMTGQIEALNHVFEDWSRTYLNDFYYGSSSDAADAVPESQLQELPPELTKQCMDLSTVQVFLRKSGRLAQSFQHEQQQAAAKQLRLQQQQQHVLLESKSSGNGAAGAQDTRTVRRATSTSSNHNSHISDCDINNSQMDLVGIPDIFFQTDFDLTNPQTFRELLLTTASADVAIEDTNAAASPSATVNTITSANNNSKANIYNNNNNRSLQESLEEPTHHLFQIPPPDHFTGYLDRIEVALLEQVRDKSEAFFQETNRFALLKEWVSGLLVDVQRIRGLLEGQARAIESWQQVPAWDRKRRHLWHMERILEGANEILRCKQCIGGLLSAKDDLGAVEQIQYARRLLAGAANETLAILTEPGELMNNGKDFSDQADDGASQQPQQQPQESHCALSDMEAPIELGRMQALRTVGEQLNQYESLVVTSLTEEVVEIFLEWNTSALATMYGRFSGNSENVGVQQPTSSRVSSQQEIQRRTMNIIQSLRMCKALSHMSKFYSTRLHDMVRMTVRTTVGEFASDASSKNAGTSVSVSVTAMSLEHFIDCLDMLFEQILELLTSAAGVDEFCKKERLDLRDTSSASNNGDRPGTGGGGDQAPERNRNTPEDRESVIQGVVASAAELSARSIAELLRLRKEVHTFVSLDEMRRIWETCMKFVDETEKLSGHKCVTIRTMLLTQAKAFVERKHDSNMIALAAALDSERWTQCEVSNERQVALTRLCTGRAGIAPGRGRRTSSAEDSLANSTKSPEAEVEGIRYKVVWSCLLLVEMIMTNIEAAACFQSLASIVIGKVSDLMRLFNSRATQLVLGAGAIHSAARLKSINAKHLSLVTQCLGMTIALLPHIRGSLSQQLPSKQQTLLTDLDKIKKEYGDHNEKVLNKFVTIIGGIVEHGLAKHIVGTDFDARAKKNSHSSQDVASCCVFLEGVLTNTRKMHQVLSALLPPEHLQDVFSRIFAFIDRKIPALLITATESTGRAPSSKTASFSFPTTQDGKKRMLDELASMTTSLNALAGVLPWEFSAVSVLAKTLEYEIPDAALEDASLQVFASGVENKDVTGESTTVGAVKRIVEVSENGTENSKAVPSGEAGDSRERTDKDTSVVRIAKTNEDGASEVDTKCRERNESAGREDCAEDVITVASERAVD